MTGARTATALVGIMAKAPRPGHAKTRLTRALPAEVAADLSYHFLLDVLAVARRVAGVGVVVVCPPGDAAELEGLQLGVAVLEQPEPGLMQGLAWAIDEGLARGHGAVALINGDSPTLPEARIEEALAALADSEVVLGPTADGGYYVIAATVSCDTLLRGAPYLSGETICRDTLARAESLGLRSGTIAPWFDVDQPDELARLAMALQDAPDDLAPHTRRALRRHHAALTSAG